MHSSRMQTVRLLTVSRTSLSNSPWMQTTLDADADPLIISLSCDLWCMLGSQPPSNMDRMTDRCKDTTFPQTLWVVKTGDLFQFKG